MVLVQIGSMHVNPEHIERISTPRRFPAGVCAEWIIHFNSGTTMCVPFNNGLEWSQLQALINQAEVSPPQECPAHPGEYGDH